MIRLIILALTLIFVAAWLRRENKAFDNYVLELQHEQKRIELF